MTKFLRRYYNSPLVIERQGVMGEGTKRQIKRFGIGVLAYGILLLYLCLHIAITISGYRLNKLGSEYRQLRNIHGALLMDLGRRANWKDMERLARAEYGFVDSHKAREIALPAASGKGVWSRMLTFLGVSKSKRR
jgi:hypothetical protein